MTEKITIEHSSLEEPLEVEAITAGDLKKWGDMETAVMVKLVEALNGQE